MGVMGTEHEAASRANVQRWVGAHIIPVRLSIPCDCSDLFIQVLPLTQSPDVNFMSSTPYDTLTPGATIAFTAINTRYHEPFDTDAAHLASVKGKKACVHAGVSNRVSPISLLCHGAMSVCLMNGYSEAL